MLELLKNYYIFMLILMVFSYLVPKENYKVYIQFFIGIFMIVLFLKPILEILTLDNPSFVTDVFEKLNTQIEQIDAKNVEGENIFEYFFFEREGE